MQHMGEFNSAKRKWVGFIRTESGYTHIYEDKDSGGSDVQVRIHEVETAETELKRQIAVYSEKNKSRFSRS